MYYFFCSCCPYALYRNKCQDLLREKYGKRLEATKLREQIDLAEKNLIISFASEGASQWKKLLDDYYLELNQVFEAIKLLDSKIRDACGYYDLLGGYYKTAEPFNYIKFISQTDQVSYQYVTGRIYDQNRRQIGMISGRLRGDKLYNGEWFIYDQYGNAEKRGKFNMDLYYLGFNGNFGYDKDEFGNKFQGSKFYDRTVFFYKPSGSSAYLPQFD